MVYEYTEALKSLLNKSNDIFKYVAQDSTFKEYTLEDHKTNIENALFEFKGVRKLPAPKEIVSDKHGKLNVDYEILFEDPSGNVNIILSDSEFSAWQVRFYWNDDPNAAYTIGRKE